VKRLYLSSRNKKIGGVCGGIAEYLDVDPTVVRLITVVVALFTAVIPALFCYLLAWIIIPVEPKG
jgi:phage shock protein C